ncbi:MAG: glycoside hydrolase family 27 protein [Bacteroidetes bacterium]|nr:glycoside hydrolase family 27 protein [Bacteroidota bacterium]
MNNKFRLLILWITCFQFFSGSAQETNNYKAKLAPTPPMGWMTWNFFGTNINEKMIHEMADAMVHSGMVKAGYNHIMIDDGWQGGRDNKNNMIPDPEKFPSGIKALADYLHAKGILLGIYSDAAQLTCAGYTASLGFEDQDAKTFASWGVDYLKYDYCHAPEDSFTAKIRYKKMADALRKSGRDIVFSICEWGGRQPWFWAAEAGGQLWRTTDDIRDSWKSLMYNMEINADLDRYSSPGHWNDPDMLIVGLDGNKGPSGDLGGKGCSAIEYQSAMSLWCIMASPLIATHDVRNMSDDTKRILLNPEAIAIDQDVLGLQGSRKINTKTWNVFVKPLANGDYAIAILNKSNESQEADLNFKDLGLEGNFVARDIWQYKDLAEKSTFHALVLSHETKLLRLRKAP